MALIARLPAGTLTRDAPEGYYGLATDAYLSGQFALKLAPDPRVLALPNPRAATEADGVVRDLTIYDGRYYFYWGVAPIVTVFAPVHLLTGRWATEGFACVLLALVAGAAFSALLVRAARRTVTSTGLLEPAVTAVAAAGVVLGGGAAVWLAEPGTYQVAEMSGVAWLALMVLFADIARDAARPVPWVAAASLAAGMVVASRPSMALGTLALAVAAWPLRRRSGAVTAAVVPAAVVGVLLAWMNWARFGSPLEFGEGYVAMTVGDTHEFVQFSARYVPEGIRAYFLSVPALSSTAPWVRVGWRESVGVAILPFSWLVAGFLRGRADRIAAPAAVVAVGVTVPLLFFFRHWSRYETEFLVWYTLLAALGLIAWAAEVPAARRGRLLWAAVACVAINAWLLSAVVVETVTRGPAPT